MILQELLKFRDTSYLYTIKNLRQLRYLREVE